MTDKKLFSLNTFWGRYLVFALLILPFSLCATIRANADYPNAHTAFLFHYGGAKLLFWALYVFISLQFMFVRKSCFSFEDYLSSVILMFWFAGVLVVFLSTYSSIQSQSLYPLNRVSFGLAFAFAAYNLQLERKGRSDGL